MKSKSLILLLIFTFSLIPFKHVQAETDINFPLEDAFLLMLTSDAILSAEWENDQSSQLHNLSSVMADEPNPDLDDATMAAILQALKDWRNELDTNCRLLTNKYKSEGKDCEADRIKATCDQYRQQINTEIGKYHKLRGDKRKAPTKVWHFLKRTGKTIWTKVGPVGRTFLRRLGPEVLQIVASGGVLNRSVVRKLVKQVARSIGREKIKQAVFQGVERLLKGQIEILQAAGVDICEESDQVQTQNQEDAQELSQGISEKEITLPDSGTWKLSCLDKWPDVIDQYGMPDWQMEINWETRQFSGKIEATSLEVDGNETLSWGWYETGSGSITEDGLFWGDFNNASTLSVQYGDNDPTITDYGYDQHWIGAISEDLDRLCFYRVGNQDWFTLDWLRERGRNEMLESNLCEAECAAP